LSRPDPERGDVAAPARASPEEATMHAVTLSHLKGGEFRDLKAAWPLDAWPTDVTRAYLLRARDGSEGTVLLCFHDGLLADAPGGVESAELSDTATAQQTYEVIREFRVQEWRSAEAAMRAGLI
jgi:hypothetical protein